MSATHLSKRAGLSQGQARLICIISIIIGATLIATTSLVTYHILRRRRKRENNHFRQACLRDPGLTWEEYERKGRLTRSRLLFEEEIQRSNMIRKSQQSRASDRKESSTVSVDHLQGLGNLQPLPSRSKSWHGRSKHAGAIDYSQHGDVEPGRTGNGDGVGLARDVTLADWSSVHASVERTWQLFHGKKFPTLPSGTHGGQLESRHDNDELEDEPPRPPTARLKTPPLLSHPIFRDDNTQHPPKHTSLPTELARAKTDPKIVTTTSSGVGLEEV